MNPEAKLQKEIIAALKGEGFTAYPIEFRGARGCPDLMVLKDDFHETAYLKDFYTFVVWLEVKVPPNALDPAQEEVFEAFASQGQRCFVVTCVEEACSHVYQEYRCG